MLMNAPGYLFTGAAIGLGLVGVSLMGLSLLNDTIGGVFFGIHTVIIGSLLTILGYQIGSLSIFSSIATDPIREPQDPITEWIEDNFNLEHSATLGVCVTCVSTLVIGWMAWTW
jgi:hypothetical protein